MSGVSKHTAKRYALIYAGPGSGHCRCRCTHMPTPTPDTTDCTARRTGERPSIYCAGDNAALCSVRCALSLCGIVRRFTGPRQAGAAAVLPSLTAPWRMGFARDKITAWGRGPLARSARRAESSPPRSLLPPPLSPLPARLSAPTRTARPIARAPHKRNGPAGTNAQ